MKYDYIYSSIPNSPHIPPMCPNFTFSSSFDNPLIQVSASRIARVWGHLLEHGEYSGNILIKMTLPPQPPSIADHSPIGGVPDLPIFSIFFILKLTFEPFLCSVKIF